MVSNTIKDGSMTLFWNDTWLDSINSEIFSRAFSFAIFLNEDRPEGPGSIILNENGGSTHSYKGPHEKGN
jgi:hypothetical protein